MKLLFGLILLLSVGLAGIAGDVATSAALVRPLLVGEKVPDVQIKDADGKAVTLAKALAGKPTILVYYRGGWCPFCSQHLSALGRKEAELKRLGFQIVAISADRPAKVKETVVGSKLTYTVLSDNTMAGAKAFGIAFKLPVETVKLYKEKYRIDVEGDSGMKHHILPVPSVFVIDAKGRVTFNYVNPNYKVRLDEDVLIAAAKAILK
jgi:peroxiredoxin